MAESGFLVPDSYIANSNQDVAQLVAIAQAVAMTAVKDEWQLLRKTYTITLTSATAYPLPSDYVAFVSGTAFQHGRWDIIDLPCTPEQWALLLSVSGISNMPIRARIIGNQFNILNPQAASVVNIEYLSNAPISDQTGVTPKKLFSQDSTQWTLDDRACFSLRPSGVFRRKKRGWTGRRTCRKPLDSGPRYAGRTIANSSIVPTRVSVSGQPYTNLWQNSR